MLCCTFSNATYAICVNVIGRSSRTWKMSTSHLVFLGRAWEMTRDFNSQEKSVSPVLETRADINAFRRTHWHHRSDGNEVTGLRNTTSCTQCSIVLRFSDKKVTSGMTYSKSTASSQFFFRSYLYVQRISGAKNVVGGPWTALRYINTTSTCISSPSFVTSYEIPKHYCRQDTPNNLFLSSLKFSESHFI